MSFDPDIASRRARRFGWLSLTGWAFLGFALEVAHGFKLDAYLDDELTRLLLRLAHAHGVGLSLLLLVYAGAGAPLFVRAPTAGAVADRLLRFGTLCLPLGFALGSIGHPEGDPGLAIVLAPLGGLAVLAALSLIAMQAFVAR